MRGVRIFQFASFLASADAGWREFGIEVFGSQLALQEIEQTSKELHVTVNGVEITMHCQKDDSFCTEDAMTMNHDHNYLDMFLEDMQGNGHNLAEIGANIGLLTVYASKVLPQLSIISVEASPINVFYLRWNLAVNGIDEGKQHIVINKAMSSDSKPYSVSHCSSNSRTSFALDSCRPQHHLWGEDDLQAMPLCEQHVVHGITLQELLREHNISNFSAMRLDCEGCEYTVLQQWDSLDLMARINHLTVEIHPEQGRRSFSTDAWQVAEEQTHAILCTHRDSYGRLPFVENIGTNSTGLGAGLPCAEGLEVKGIDSAVTRWMGEFSIDMASSQFQA